MFSYFSALFRELLYFITEVTEYAVPSFPLQYLHNETVLITLLTVICCLDDYMVCFGQMYYACFFCVRIGGQRLAGLVA